MAFADIIRELERQRAQDQKGSGLRFIPPDEAIQDFPSRSGTAGEPGPQQTQAIPDAGASEQPFHTIPPQGPRAMGEDLLPSQGLQQNLVQGAYPQDLSDDALRAAQRRTNLEQAVGFGSGYHPGAAANAVAAGFHLQPTAPVTNLQTPTERLLQRREQYDKARAGGKSQIELEGLMRQKAEQEQEMQLDSDPTSTVSQAKRDIVKKFFPQVKIPDSVPGKALNSLLGLGEKVYGIDINAAVASQKLAYERAQKAAQNNYGQNWRISDAPVDVPGMPGMQLPKIVAHEPPAGQREQFINMEASEAQLQQLIDDADKQWKLVQQGGKGEVAARSALTSIIAQIESRAQTLGQQGRLVMGSGDPRVNALILTNPSSVQQNVAQRLLGQVGVKLNLNKDFGAQLEALRQGARNTIHSSAMSIGLVPKDPAQVEGYLTHLAGHLSKSEDPRAVAAYIRDLGLPPEQQQALVGKIIALKNSEPNKFKVVKSKADYDALPPGAPYQDESGKTYRKK